MEQGLRFAPLIRVSTEKQEKRGESLSTQKKQLESAIKNLNGSVYKWYEGQEHGTPDHERKILDELMTDAQASRFDAVMVVDASRWSRDNQKSKTYLSILKKQDIEFYLLTRHMDLTQPFNNLILGMGVEINEYFAAEQAYKSMINKVERAKKGYPSSGQIPYGRTFNKETKTWSIDKEKQQIVQDAANRYLKEEGLRNIAAFYKMNLPNLHKILKQRSGDSYDIHFRSEKFGIDETVAMKVPRLLPQDIIEKIKRRSAANLTFTHGQSKHQYLLARMIFCSECGMAFFGQASRKGLLHYRHSRTDRCKKPNAYLPAPIIESNILSDIFRMFGDRPAMERAAKAAIPDLKESEALLLTVSQAEKALAKIERAKDNLLSQVEQGNLVGDDLKNRMAKLKESESRLLSALDSAKQKMQSIPTKEAIAKKSVWLMRLTKDILKSEGHLAEMSFDDKRKLLQAVFDGKDADGKRLGVYISKNKKGDWIYTIKGIMGLSLTDFVRQLEPSRPEDYLMESDYIEKEKQDLPCIHAPYHRRGDDQ